MPLHDSYLDEIAAFERKFCSNFVCCGCRHSDLHELLEHFEDAHLVVLDPDGTPLYPSIANTRPPPSPSPPPLSPPSPSSSSSYCSPAPLSAATYLGLAYPTQCHPLSGSVQDDSPADPAYVYGHPPFSTDGLAYDDLSPPLLPLDPSPYTTAPLPPYGSREAQDASPMPPAVKSTAPPREAEDAMLRAARRVRKSHASPGKREKMFKCPKHGCTKSYLNPNGLKYHIEKGTCTVL